MSGKKARKEAKRELNRKVGFCLRCGKQLRRKHRRCPDCGERSPLYAGTKNVSALLAKSASGKVAPIWKARGRRACPNGHVGGWTDTFCSRCGSPLSASQTGYQALKAADPYRSHPLYPRWEAETNPGMQAHLLHTIHQETTGRDPARTVAWIAKAHGYASVHDLIASEPDPGKRAIYERMTNPLIYGPEGGRTA